uniref:Uncharacterized protein n=1 Tax=Onchocerca volvulus TaxID=6282 RepID=A0A8R1TMQ3_ONCVO
MQKRILSIIARPRKELTKWNLIHRRPKGLPKENLIQLSEVNFRLRLNSANIKTIGLCNAINEIFLSLFIAEVVKTRNFTKGQKASNIKTLSV